MRERKKADLEIVLQVQVTGKYSQPTLRKIEASRPRFRDTEIEIVWANRAFIRLGYGSHLITSSKEIKAILTTRWITQNIYFL